MTKPLDLTPLAQPLQHLNAVRQELNNSLLERSDAIHVALVALVAREHVVYLGPPGTGKSMLITRLAQHVAPSAGGGLTSFVRLLTRFSTPEELFGPVDVSALEKGRYERVTTNTLVTTHLGFLDEIFKANSAILNSLLTLINERQYDNGTQRIQCPLISLFGASNEMPADQELGALWDRIALRLEIPNISKSNFKNLLRLMSNGANHPPTAFLPMADLVALQQAVAKVVIPNSIFDGAEKLNIELTKAGITTSNRRWGILLKLMRANALLDGRGMVEEDDFDIAKYCLWQEPEQQRDVARLVAKMANPLNARAIELDDEAGSIFDAVMAEVGENSDLSEVETSSLIAAITKTRRVVKQLRQLYETASSQSRNTTKIEAIGKKVRERQQLLMEKAMPV